MLSLIKNTSKLAFTGVSLSFMNSKISKCSSSESPENDVSRNFITIINPVKDSSVYGVVSFSQKNYSSKTKIVAQILQANPNSKHSLLIHEYGDNLGQGKNLGSVFDGKTGFKGIIIILYFIL